MARKHNRKGIKVPVEQILVTPEATERKVKLNPETDEYEVTNVVTPAVYKQGRAKQSTLEKGARNDGGQNAGIKKPKQAK